MRVRIGLFRLSLVLAALPGLASAQAPAAFSRPVLGYVFDSASDSVRVMSGVPGAATLEWAFDWKGGPLSIAPGHSFALAAAKQLTLVDWTAGAPVARTLGAMEETPADIAFSPSGRTAVVWYRSGTLEVWTKLPAAALQWQGPAALPEDAPAAFAVSDDGQAVAALAGGQLLRLAPSGGWLPVDPGASYRAIAFAPGTQDLAAAGAGQIALFRNAAGARSVVTEFSGEAAALAFSRDGSRLLVANHGKETILSVDPASGESAIIECQCRPDGFYAARGNAVFRLNQAAKGNLLLVDAEGDTPRIVIVAAPAEGGVR